MKFGMPTLIEIESIENQAELCAELNLDFIELNMNLPEYQADKLNVKHLTEITKKHGIYYTIHLDENLNPCDFNNKITMAYTETVLNIIEIAKQLKTPILNMHMNSGIRFTMPDKKIFLFEKYKQEYLRKLINFKNICEKAIGNYDIKICVENCGDFGRTSFIRDGLEVLLKSPVFALTFDIGHNAAADYTDEPIIIKYIDKLRHMHIHDAKGSNNHLPLGEGNIDLMKYINLADGNNCRAVLEVKTVEGLKQSVKRLKKILLY